MGLRITAALSILVGIAGIAGADSASEAQAHKEQGLRRYNTQDYEGAIREWREAYVLVPNPDTLFAIGQAQRMMGDCKAALVTYKTVLRNVASADQTDEINKVIAVCEKKLAETPVEDKTTPNEPTPPKPAVVHKPWFKDPLGMSLLVLGTGGVVVGGTFFMMGRGAEHDADGATSYESYAAAADLAKRDHEIAIISGAAGGALLLGAIVRFATRSSTVEINPTATSGGAGISFAGRF